MTDEENIADLILSESKENFEIAIELIKSQQLDYKIVAKVMVDKLWTRVTAKVNLILSKVVSTEFDLIPINNYTYSFKNNRIYDLTLFAWSGYSFADEVAIYQIRPARNSLIMAEPKHFCTRDSTQNLLDSQKALKECVKNIEVHLKLQNQQKLEYDFRLILEHEQ